MKTRISFLLLQEDDEVDEVIFDELGVVTDLEKIRRLREENESHKQCKERQFNRKPLVNKSKCKARVHKKSSSLKRNRSKKLKIASGKDSGSEESGREKKVGDFEDGELTTSSSTTTDIESDSGVDKPKVPIFKVGGRFQGIERSCFFFSEKRNSRWCC